MKIIIRQEKESDYSTTENVVQKAFENMEFAGKDEHILVRNLRKNKSFIPELSLVAVVDGEIAGHILFSKISITGEKNYESLTLAPVSVLPDFQRKGIGKKLVKAGLQKAIELGWESVIVVGHKDYYPKFGFEKASKWGITCPIELPDGVFMAIELIPGTLKNKTGVVKFPEEFGIV